MNIKLDEKAFEEKQFELSVEDPACVNCQECSGRMQYVGSGKFVCVECGHEHLSDFGKVKKYLQENGPRNAMQVAKDTGVSLPSIQKLLNEGRIETVSGETEYQLWSKLKE